MDFWVLIWGMYSPKNSFLFETYVSFFPPSSGKSTVSLKEGGTLFQWLIRFLQVMRMAAAGVVCVFFNHHKLLSDILA